MNADMFKYKEITDIILSFYEAYNELGDGFLEFKRFVYDNKRKNISDDQRRSVAE